MTYVTFSTSDPTLARRYLDRGGTAYMSQELREAVIDAVANHHFRVCDPRMHGDPTLVYCGKGDPVGEDLEIMERIKALHKRDWDKYSMPTENGVPYSELSHEELLEIAKRPNFEEKRQRDYFIWKTQDWELTRAFVDARNDLSDKDWMGVTDRLDDAQGREDALEDMRRWLDTKRIGENMIWYLARFYAMPEASDHLSVETLLKKLKEDDYISQKVSWLAVMRKVDTRLLEVTNTKVLRTLGRIVGMNGRRYSMRELKMLLSGETVDVLHYIDSYGYHDASSSRRDAEEFISGFQSVEHVNPDTLLSMLRFLRRHPESSSLGEWIDRLSEREEAKNSVKIQRWLTK